MFLDEMIAAQKRGEARGVASVCSAHPTVLNVAIKQALRALESHGALLIEATCNQVNQFGGYTGMKPADFVRYVHGIAKENKLPFEYILLGGDHLGPSVWQDEPAESAMQKSAELVRDYVGAGFTKIHFDSSMRLADDPAGRLDAEVSARRAAQLAKIAEQTAITSGGGAPRYVIGTEVPVPGGARERGDSVGITTVENARQTIEVTREAFRREGLESAWERVIAVVVEPGVEFGDDFVWAYQPSATRELSRFIEWQPMVYEAHSTDYQRRQALKSLVRDHFAILKVGPGLTFAFREAVFALAMMEDELFPANMRSHLIRVLDYVMVRHPRYWQKYYLGTPDVQAFKRKFSFSDRARYYWPDPHVQNALDILLRNLNDKPLPFSLLSQYAPMEMEKIRAGMIENKADAIISDHVSRVLDDYVFACGGN